ncbi:MAG: hypothetical protein U9O94_04925, partial [Nanoarchaeota archaeon]|nr:hypothetical protein [Nanoarchaeota archaeon]
MSFESVDKRISNSKGYAFYKKYEKPIHAIEGIIVVLLLITLISVYVQNTKFLKEVSDDCQWEDEEMQCITYCDKFTVGMLDGKL